MMNSGRVTDRFEDEKGIALVAALCISVVLLIFAFALTYRMSTYLRMLATSKEKNQTYYTAVAGTEQMRDVLRTALCQPPTWCGLLGIAGDRVNPNYRDITRFVTGVAAPATFPDTGDPGETRTHYAIFLKDNDEFDNDYTSDNDELIIAVATSSSATRDETRTSLEAGLLFDAEALNPYKQLGQTAGRKSTTNETGNITMQRRL